MGVVELKKLTSFVDGLDCQCRTTFPTVEEQEKQSFDVYRKPSCLSWMRKTEKSNVIFNLCRVSLEMQGLRNEVEHFRHLEK